MHSGGKALQIEKKQPDSSFLRIFLKNSRISPVFSSFSRISPLPHLGASGTFFVLILKGIRTYCKRARLVIINVRVRLLFGLFFLDYSENDVQ